MPARLPECAARAWSVAPAWDACIEACGQPTPALLARSAAGASAADVLRKLPGKLLLRGPATCMPATCRQAGETASPDVHTLALLWRGPGLLGCRVCGWVLWLGARGAVSALLGTRAAAAADTAASAAATLATARTALMGCSACCLLCCLLLRVTVVTAGCSCLVAGGGADGCCLLAVSASPAGSSL